jgi:hypothetical protein
MFGALENYPPGHQRFFMEKTLRVTRVSSG